MLHRLSRAQPQEQIWRQGHSCAGTHPTRELAAQVEESVRDYGKYLDINSTVVFGGVGMNPQIDRIKRGVDVLVARPGVCSTCSSKVSWIFPRLKFWCWTKGPHARQRVHP